MGKGQPEDQTGWALSEAGSQEKNERDLLPPMVQWPFKLHGNTVKGQIIKIWLEF